MFAVDCKGLSCPIPVVNTKKALNAHPEGVDVIVDNIVPKENVTRYAKAVGYKVDAAEDDGIWTLKIRK